MHVSINTQPLPTVDTVVSTCILRDAEIWRYAAPQILKHIRSKRYVLIVPNNAVQIFKVISPSKFTIMPEECVIKETSVDSIKNLLPEALASRAGWYYQQILKIEYLRSMEDRVLGLIWDADTIPVRDLDFVDDTGRLIYRFGVHQPRIHEPYFELIESVLGIKRSLNESFISQCFPAYSTWVRNFCSEIEGRGGQEWWKIVLAYLYKNPHSCGFSEYESMGTFIAKNYAEEVVYKNGHYYRPFNLIYAPDEIDSDHCSKLLDSMNLEYVAFDAYNTNKITGLNIGCGNKRLITTYDGGLFINVDINQTLATDMTANLDNGLPFKNGHFTHIVAHNILEHVDQFAAAVAELDRVLAPGGIFQIEVPHIGSYNHGTDVTHKRGLTFDSFNFLFQRPSYLYPNGSGPFNYKLISFNRENVINGTLIREEFIEIPSRGTYTEWLERVYRFEIPGSFGFLFQKIS